MCASVRRKGTRASSRFEANCWIVANTVLAVMLDGPDDSGPHFLMEPPMARNDQVRYQLFLSRHLSMRFDRLARAYGESKSAILSEALTAYLDRNCDEALELPLAPRVDKISKQIARIERNNHVLRKSLSLFIRYMLTVNPP